MNEQKREMNFPVGGTEPKTFERDLSTGSSPALVRDFTSIQSNSAVISGRNVCRTPHLRLLPVNESVPVCRGEHTPVGPQPVSSVQQSEGHELTPEEALSVAFARRRNREALFLRARMHSLCNNSTSPPPRGRWWGGYEWPRPNTGTGLHQTPRPSAR